MPLGLAGLASLPASFAQLNTRKGFYSRPLLPNLAASSQLRQLAGGLLRSFSHPLLYASFYSSGRQPGARASALCLAGSQPASWRRSGFRPGHPSRGGGPKRWWHFHNESGHRQRGPSAYVTHSKSGNNTGKASTHASQAGLHCVAKSGGRISHACGYPSKLLALAGQLVAAWFSQASTRAAWFLASTLAGFDSLECFSGIQKSSIL